MNIYCNYKIEYNFLNLYFVEKLLIIIYKYEYFMIIYI